MIVYWPNVSLRDFFFFLAFIIHQEKKVHSLEQNLNKPHEVHSTNIATIVYKPLHIVEVKHYSFCLHNTAGSNFHARGYMWFSMGLLKIQGYCYCHTWNLRAWYHTHWTFSPMSHWCISLPAALVKDYCVCFNESLFSPFHIIFINLCILLTNVTDSLTEQNACQVKLIWHFVSLKELG